MYNFKPRISNCLIYKQTKIFSVHGLKSLQGKSGSPVKNAKEFANFVSSQTVAEDEQIVSFGVVSLFTSIPLDLAIDIVQRKLEESTEWKALTSLTQAQILDLLSFVLNNSYFSFEGN